MRYVHACGDRVPSAAQAFAHLLTCRLDPERVVAQRASRQQVFDEPIHTTIRRGDR